MNLSNFKLKIGQKEITGVGAIVLGILILIPVLAVIGVILSIIFSIIGIVISIALGIALVAIIIGLIVMLIPKKWREKLGVKISWHKDSKERPQTTPEGKDIVDVKYKEDK